jgi:phenylpropionate dioxygenase-like ring-hydroxylating dioxygenase large terminal subunit
MQPLIQPRDYFDPDVFRAEQAAIFERAWLFAGFAADLASPNDYVTTRVGGRSVVVQNFDGELRAYANVCSHRFARLKAEGQGNGLLRCPYHGWIYNRDGVPYSIPSRPRFDALTPEVIDSLRLRAYDVDTCGALVFVRARRAGGPSLREYLGGAGDTIEDMSRGMGAKIDRNEVVFGSNWKVAVENTLESYHVGFVHENTFKKLGAKGMDFRFDGPHSAWKAPVDPGTEAQMRKLLALYKAPWSTDGYHHQLVFPNLTVVTLFGTSFGIQLFEPVSPTETRLTSHIFAPKAGAEVRMNAAVAEMMNQSTAEFARTVFEEDKVVCAAVQLGLPETDKLGILSDEEERVLRFHEAYVGAMTAAADGAGADAAPGTAGDCAGACALAAAGGAA